MDEREELIALRRLAALEAKMGGQAKTQAPAFDPSEGGGTLQFGPFNTGIKTPQGVERFLAGTGKAFADIGRGVGQMAGMVSRQDVEDSRKLDAPLMETGAGTAGNILGNVAALTPTALIPGAATMRGAALIGGLTGLTAPSTSTGETIKNTALGGVLAPAAMALGRGAAAGYRGAGALIAPFTQGGRERIAGRTLQEFGIGANDLAGLRGGPSITGASPMLAELIQDPAAAMGAARLQGGLRSADPRAAAAFTALESQNNAARLGMLDELAGAGGGREFAAANRAGTSGPMYQQAFAVDAGTAFTPEMQREMASLMKSPAIKSAMQAAQVNGANAGKNVGSSNGSGSIEGLHQMKMALDDAIKLAKGGGGSPAQDAKADGLIAAKNRLVGFIEKLSDDYKSARTVHAQMSLPINQMDAIAELRRAGTSATSDLAGNARLMPNQLMRAMQDEAALIKRGTGRSAGKSLDDLLDPDQLAKVRAIVSETDRMGAVARAENGPGSATASRLASQNLLKRILGPTGMPDSWGDSVLAETVARPFQFMTNAAEPRIQQELMEALMDPVKARGLLDAVSKSNRGGLLGQTLQPAIPALSGGGLLSYRAQQ